MHQRAASVIAHTEASTGAELPRFIKEEFDAPLECDILANGLLRLRCGECGHDKLLAFSCKRHGFCQSCGARRVSQTAAHLVGHVIPYLPMRQWALSLPFPLRLLLAAQPERVTRPDRPTYWDVTYNFRGVEHRVQMTSPPGATVQVNDQGEPRG